MTRRTKAVLLGAVGIMLAAGITGGALASGTVGDDGDQNVTGPEADKAVAAALAATGGGKANSVELDSEDGATWEVEVTKTDGDTVDVRLDESFAVVVIEGDSEDAGENK